MRSRSELHMALREALGSQYVYYQVPESIKLQYPCIVYDLNDINNIQADDLKYIRHDSYLLTLVDYDPDSPIVDKLLDLPYCKFDRVFKSNQLYHFTFLIHL